MSFTKPLQMCGPPFVGCLLAILTVVEPISALTCNQLASSSVHIIQTASAGPDQEVSLFEAQFILRQMGVRFDRVTREGRTVLRILESPDAIHQWARTANGITRVFDRPVEVDKYWDDLAQRYVIAANITGDLGRIVFSPNSLSGNLTHRSFLHHEAVHEKTNEANFTSPDSPRASWLVLFTKDGGPIDSALPQEYQSRIRSDEILAYYKSLVFRL